MLYIFKNIFLTNDYFKVDKIQRYRTNFLALRSSGYLQKTLGDISDLKNMLHIVNYNQFCIDKSCNLSVDTGLSQQKCN